MVAKNIHPQFFGKLSQDCVTQ